MRTRRAKAWLQGFEERMTAFQPGREQIFTALVDAIDAYCDGRDRPLRLLDLGGGAGSWSLRALRRWPDADVTLADRSALTDRTS